MFWVTSTPVSLPETLIAKYLRVCREWQLVDVGSAHRQRLATELAGLERTSSTWARCSLPIRSQANSCMVIQTRTRR